MDVLAPVGMGRLVAAGLVCFLAVPLVLSQSDTQSLRNLPRPDVLTIVNSGQNDLPGERARVLLLTTSRIIAEEFHQKPEDVELKITLVLGDPNERVAIDDNGRASLHMERWDETKFVDGVMTATIQKLMPLRRREKMFTEILRRTDKIAPIPANQLRAPGVSFPSPKAGNFRDCISAVSMTPCSGAPFR